MTEKQIEKNKEIFLSIARENIQREGIENLLGMLENTDFFEAPASTRFHDAEDGGLCKHSIDVYNELLRECLDHNGCPLTPYELETLTIVSLFHDVCKVHFYEKFLRNVKDDKTGKWHKEPSYRVNDQFPYGHGEKSVYLINELMRLTPDEAMSINAHMGGFDERGFIISNTFEKCDLAVYLHVADLKVCYL